MGWLAIALSVGAYMLSQLRFKPANATIKPIKQKLVKGSDEYRHMFEKYRQMYERTRSDSTAEIEKLKNLVHEMQRREENLQWELLECCGQMQRLNLRIIFLETQNKKVEEEVAESSLVKAELESATVKKNELQRQMQMESMQTKEQFDMLKQEVAVLQDTQKELEVEVVELRRANEELKHEKRELMQKLETKEEVKTLWRMKIGQRKWKVCKVNDLVKMRCLHY